MREDKLYKKDPFNMSDFKKFAKTTEGMNMVEFLSYCNMFGGKLQERIYKAFKNRIKDYKD